MHHERKEDDIAALRQGGRLITHATSHARSRIMPASANFDFYVSRFNADTLIDAE